MYHKCFIQALEIVNANKYYQSPLYAIAFLKGILYVLALHYYLQKAKWSSTALGSGRNLQHTCHNVLFASLKTLKVSPSLF